MLARSSLFLALSMPKRSLRACTMAGSARPCVHCVSGPESMGWPEAVNPKESVALQ